MNRRTKISINPFVSHAKPGATSKKTRQKLQPKNPNFEGANKTLEASPLLSTLTCLLFYTINREVEGGRAYKTAAATAAT